MHFLMIQLFFILFCQNVLAVSYNTPCTTTCNFPGMVCVYGKCKCDVKSRFFWTGARCLSCPHDWGISEIACIGYYGTKLSLQNALSTCQKIQGDLISVRDNSILPLIYQVTGGVNGRRKRDGIAADVIVAWTSAYAVQLTSVGLYQWNDNSLPKFDSRHKWWCRPGIEDMGYFYTYTEPTRFVTNHGEERCVLLRRGRSTSQMICLDDTFCDLEYPFICERSESTAQKFIGPPPMNGGGSGSSSSSQGSSSSSQGSSSSSQGSSSSSQGSSSSSQGSSSSSQGSSSSSQGNAVGSHGENANSNINGGQQLATVLNPSALKSNKENKHIIVIIIIGLLLIAGILIGVFFFIRHRNAARTQFPVGGNNFKADQTPYSGQQPVKNDPIDTDINNVAELPPQRISADETGLILDTNLTHGNINIGNQKQQKNRRGGFSKQQFDEFQ